jgi:hypothetical protein
MKRPPELQQLVEDLKAENVNSSTVVQKDSCFIVVLLEDDAEKRYKFSSEESKILLASPDTVVRLFEFIDNECPDEIYVELHNLVVDEDVMSKLENYASAVDEF